MIEYSSGDKTVTCTAADLVEWFKSGDKRIQLIKSLRSVSIPTEGGAMGLKEAKDVLDACHTSLDVLNAFDKYAAIVRPPPMTKKAFLALIEKALDASEPMYYDDYLEVLEVFVTNVRKKGGLIVLAHEQGLADRVMMSL